MKSCVAFTALIIAATFDLGRGLAIYLKELPNGGSFTQELGHPGMDSSEYTNFANEFAAAGHKWTPKFCAATFPGSDMTNGAAFGDPCCTWSKDSATPDFAVAAFTTTPGDATVCASTSDTTSSATTDVPENTDAPATEAQSVYAPESTEDSSTSASPSTDAPNLTDAPAYADAPETATVPAVTDAPATITPSSGGCKAKSDNVTQNYHRFRH